MKVCLLSPSLPGSDPGDAVGEHARRLAADHGIAVTVALTDPPAGGAPSRLGDARVVAIADALGDRFDVAVATAWRATVRLFEVQAQRHACFVERLEHHHMYEWQAERIAAALSYDLPVDFLAADQRVAEQLAELRPDARCLLAPAGIAKDVFVPGPGAGGGPLRIASLADVDAKGIAGAMGEEHDLELVDPGAGATARAAALAKSDVALVVSADARFAREALQAGLACVSHFEDLVIHDRNGLVAAQRDFAGTARELDLLARDRERLARLRAGAVESAAGFPSLEEASAAMAAALERLAAESPPDGVAWPSRLMADAIAQATIFDNELQAYARELERVQSDPAHQAAARARELLEQPRMAPARRLIRAARRRVSPD